jgi:hypothetical protein
LNEHVRLVNIQEQANTKDQQKQLVKNFIFNATKREDPENIDDKLGSHFRSDGERHV